MATRNEMIAMLEEELTTQKEVLKRINRTVAYYTGARSNKNRFGEFHSIWDDEREFDNILKYGKDEAVMRNKWVRDTYIITDRMSVAVQRMEQKLSTYRLYG